MPVQPLQASACVGFQLDDPLPSVVAVVQVQEVCVRVQAVLTCRKHTETTLIKDTKSSRKKLYFMYLPTIIIRINESTEFVSNNQVV